MKQLKKVKNKDLFNEINNLISKYEKIISSEKKNLPKQSEEELPKKNIIQKKEEVKDSTRNNTRIILLKHLETYLKDKKEIEKLTETIANIEEKIFNEYKSEASYVNKVLEILHNIKDVENKEFSHNIVEGNISPEELAIMDENDMVKQRKREEIQRKIDNKINALKDLKKTADIKEGVYKCSKCGSKKTIQNEMQIRSADEPTTIFIQCTNCGKRWKI